MEGRSPEAAPNGREILVAVAVALLGSLALAALMLSPAGPLPVGWFVVAEAALFAAAAWAAVARRPYPGRTLGFRQPNGRVVALGAGGGAALILGNVLLDAAMNAVFGRGLRLPSLVETEVAGEAGGALGVALAGIALAVPLAEEMFFRGLLFRWLDRRAGFFLAAASSSAAFSLAHIPTTLDWALVAFGSGVVLAALLRATDNLWAPCVAHALVNATAVLAALSAPA